MLLSQGIACCHCAMLTLSSYLPLYSSSYLYLYLSSTYMVEALLPLREARLQHPRYQDKTCVCCQLPGAAAHVRRPRTLPQYFFRAINRSQTSPAQDRQHRKKLCSLPQPSPHLGSAACSCLCSSLISAAFAAVKARAARQRNARESFIVATVLPALFVYSTLLLNALNIRKVWKHFCTASKQRYG